jgi:hypothetical protein
MKTLFILSSLIISSTTIAEDYGYLKKSDQTYFKNDSMDGQNKMERIDQNVKEINKLHGEIARMKQEIALLKEEIQKLKDKK